MGWTTGVPLPPQEMMGFFSSPHQYQLWVPPSFPTNGYRGCLSRCKAAGAWNWPLISI